MNKAIRTNITGNQLEVAVKTVLTGKGFQLARYREWIKNPLQYSTELLLENVPYTTIYGHKGNTEFLLKSEKYRLKMRIECKWQQVAGSVDEKMPYLYLNMVEKMPEETIMVLIDGPGWKEGAIRWLKSAAGKSKYTNAKKELLIFTLADFFTWSNQTFF
ncbi:PD-(D/E)XK nuclease superfamily protein [Bacteroidota bacterium]